MLSFELQQSIAAFLAHGTEYGELLGVVESFADFYDDIGPSIAALSAGGEKLNQAAAVVQSRFSKFHTITRQISPSKVYAARIALRSVVDDVFDATLREHFFVKSYLAGIDELTDLYDKYLMEQSSSNAAELMIRASQLRHQQVALLNSLNFVAAALQNQHAAAPDESVLSVVLFQVSSLSSYAAKLYSLEQLYDELSLLCGVALGERPLRVAKIESGSLWIKVFGETRVTEMLASILKGAAGYLYRKFTTEGKISSIPGKIETLDAVIHLSERLKSIGIETSTMNEDLRKSGVVIARNLATLLEDQVRVKVNDQVIGVEAAFEQMLLEQRASLLLSNEMRSAGPKFDEPDSSTQGAA